LYELNIALEQLQNEYKFDINYDNTVDEDYEKNVPIDDDMFYSTFTNTQIEEFHKI
ncbi:1210_t:CDS:1, partial [Funneliformis mosseae]